jgi:hypothetical protein
MPRSSSSSAGRPSRRDWLRLAAAGVAGCSMSGWLERFAAAGARDPQRKRSCILLWMNGGPSTIDLWDLKPGHANGGPFKEISTNVPGIKISEHLPKLARHADRMAIVRSMSTKEADHGRATYLMRTGRVPGGPVQYPVLGSLVAKELGSDDAELPGFVSIAPFRFLSPAAFGPGFLGPQYAPLVVGESAGFGQQPGAQNPDALLKVQDLDAPAGVSAGRVGARVQLLDEMEQDFLAGRGGPAALGHRTAYQRAVTLMRSSAVKAFDLDGEPAALRDAYGRNLFGQGCLLARRLVERGVPFVEISLSSPEGGGGPGWDTHQNNFEQVKRLSATLDAGWATLMNDLKSRGLIDTTLVVWMGEFGRTPKINPGQGRDHWAASWATVLAGGGIKGGQAVGSTTPDGMEVKDRPVGVPDFLATVAAALGIDPRKQNDSNVGRPIRFAEPTAQVIKEVVV